LPENSFGGVHDTTSLDKSLIFARKLHNNITRESWARDEDKKRKIHKLIQLTKPKNDSYPGLLPLTTFGHKTRWDHSTAPEPALSLSALRVCHCTMRHIKPHIPKLKNANTCMHTLNKQAAVQSSHYRQTRINIHKHLHAGVLHRCRSVSACDMIAESPDIKICC